MEQKLTSVRQEIAEMVSNVVKATGIPFEQTSELQRQLLASFAFGMIFTVGRLKHLTPSDVHALVIACLIDVFKYTSHQATAFAEDLIAAASNKAPHSTINAVIHRGIDGHRQWQTGEMDSLRDNLADIFRRVGA